MNLLTTNAAAKILGVSGATVRNWCRAGHLESSQTRPLLFNKSTVLALKERIRTNRFNRLRKRANKTMAHHIPRPERTNPEMGAYLGKACDRIVKQGINPVHVVFLAALRYLEAEDEVCLPSGNTAKANPADLKWRRKPVKDIILGWRQRIPGNLHDGAGEDLDDFLSWRHTEDCLGALHQALSSVEKKSRAGAYFTPGALIDASLEDMGSAPENFLDPCCGTGRYLLRAAARFAIDPTKLYGFDSDPVAVDIARLNLLLLHRDLTIIPKVRCLDSLKELANGYPSCDTNGLLGTIDAIATNPPWGGCKNQVRHKNLISLVKSGESFSLFLEKSLQLLRPGGRLSFVLPESMLKIKAHADIRRLILEETTVKKVVLLGRVFADVFTPIMRLDLEKKAAPPDWLVRVERNGRSHHAPQKRFAANDGYAFDVSVTPRDEKLLAKIYQKPHATLRDHAEWALGIVTGDNGRCVLGTQVAGSEPVLRGRDLYKFSPRPPRFFIKFRPEKFQQVAPERLYRAPEKLIYRFVSDRLVFAYDDRQYLTLNSANILIPHLPNMSIKAVLAFLNSLVFQYVFIKRFRTRKILRGDLETLPFPIVDAGFLHMIEHQVDLCMGGEYMPADELDEMIQHAFGLDQSDVRAMEESLTIESETPIL